MDMEELVMLSKELVAASAEPLILSLLSRGESYGYSIIQEVKARSKDRIQWTDGMPYPVLHRMESEGWITSRWVQAENGRKRKYYSIKKDGKQALELARVACRRAPKESRCHLALSAAYAETGDFALAQSELRQAYRLPHYDPAAIVALQARFAAKEPFRGQLKLR